MDMFSLNQNIQNEIQQMDISEQQHNYHTGRINENADFKNDHLNPKTEARLERMTSAHAYI